MILVFAMDVFDGFDELKCANEGQRGSEMFRIYLLWPIGTLILIVDCKVLTHRLWKNY